MKPTRDLTKTNVSPSHDVLVINGPNVHESDCELIKFLVKKSGLRHTAYGDGRSNIDPDRIKEVIAQRLDTTGHVILAAHGGVNKGRHFIHIKDEFGVFPTADLLGAPTNRQEISSLEKRETWHLLTCHGGRLRDAIKPGSPEWKQRTVFIYSSSKPTVNESFTDSVEAIMGYVSACKQNQIAADPLTIFLHLTKTQGDCVTVLGGDLHAPLVSHAPKTHADQSGKSRRMRLAGDPRDLALLKAKQKAMGHDMKQTMNEARSQLRSIFFARIDRLDIGSTEAILQQHPHLINCRGILGYTPLMVAAHLGSKKMIQALLKFKSNLHAQDNEGDTPLIKAIYSKKPAAVACLLEAGARVSDMDKDGDQALAIAASFGYSKMVKLFLQHPFGVAINACNKKGSTALIYAAMHGHPASVRRLLQAGADCTIKNNAGKTAQEIATLNGYIKTAKLISKYQYRRSQQKTTTASITTASTATASTATASTATVSTTSHLQ